MIAHTVPHGLPNTCRAIFQRWKRLQSSVRDGGLIGNYNSVVKNVKILVKIECNACPEMGS